jgi:hypothetical protein
MLGRSFSTVVALLLGMAATTTAHAQQTLLDQVVRNNWLQCRMVNGRIRIEATQLGNIQFTNSKGLLRDETVSLRSENGRVALSYRRTTNTEKLSVEVEASGDRLLIRQNPREKSSNPSVEFRQTRDEKISLTLGSGTEQQVFRTSDLWRLLIVRPKECRQYLIPLLEMLRPKFNFNEMTAEVEARLLENDSGKTTLGREHWAGLVKQLGDDRFAKRQAADRALRSGDVPALAYLKQLNFSRLDAEQQFRIGRILESQTGQRNDDTPLEVATSLAVDPSIWLALLSRPQQTVRETAAHRLEALLGGPIPVDPTADPDSQKAQREQLRVRIEQ